MRKFIYLAFVLSAIPVHAVITTGASDFSAEVKILRKIAQCAQKGGSTEVIRSCRKGLLLKGFTQSQLDILFSWFAQKTEITYPKICPKSEIEIIPTKTFAKTKTILCSKFKKETLEMTVFFFMGEEHEKNILLSIKER
ncbi:hypothetical protein [Bdellovibrio bacteriovorus]|uniref:hypothetical protein n=1 Tax=Bdellovibrio TaxID=958 RepID=UPI0035A81847